MEKSKLYLDNCCFNRPFDDQSQLIVRLETEAVLSIQKQIKAGKIEIAWSSVLDFEIKKNPFRSRREVFDVFLGLSRNIVDIDDEVKQLSLDFHSQGLGWVDALHVSCAVKAGCEYFVTVDKRILNKTISEIEILNPVQFIQHQTILNDE